MSAAQPVASLRGRSCPAAVRRPARGGVRSGSPRRPVRTACRPREPRDGRRRRAAARHRCRRAMPGRRRSRRAGRCGPRRARRRLRRHTGRTGTRVARRAAVPTSRRRRHRGGCTRARRRPRRVRARRDPGAPPTSAVAPAHAAVSPLARRSGAAAALRCGDELERVGRALREPRRTACGADGPTACSSRSWPEPPRAARSTSAAARAPTRSGSPGPGGRSPASMCRRWRWSGPRLPRAPQASAWSGSAPTSRPRPWRPAATTWSPCTTRR